MLDERYIPDISLSEYLVDPETGEPITGGTVSFFQDDARAIPKLVYELSGSPPNYTYTALPNPMDVSIGRPVNENGDNVAIYYFPFDDLGNVQNYYIVVKNADGVTTEIREAWPNITETSSPTETENSITNDLSNSQFVDVLFNDAYGTTIQITGATSNVEYDIAPGWFLRASTNDDAVIVVNRTALAGSLNIDTNPPYRLDILPEGASITSLKLVQRLYNNPDIWSNGFVAGSLVATSLDGISHTIEMLYAPSISPASNTIFSETTGDSGYVRMLATIELDAGTNTDAPPDAYVDIEIVLPVNGEVGITSVQLVGLNTDEEGVSYDQQPVNRQEDYLFHYYNPLIQEVPVPSILEGWDFKVNPGQFGSSGSLAGVASKYMWDQLIGWQSANNLLSYSRGTPRSLVLTHAASAGQIAIIQYMAGPQLRMLLSNSFSVLMKGYTTLATGIGGTVSFWYTTDGSLPVVATGTNQSLISTLDANGKPATFHGNWTEIPRNYRGEGRFTLPYNADDLWQEIAIDGWNRETNAINGSATFGAIVIGFETSSISHTVVLDSVAVTPGLLARPYAPLSYTLTLKQLEYYYEKSYFVDVNPGTVTDAGAITCQMPTFFTNVSGSIYDFISYPGAFNIIFKEISRSSTPVMTIYSPESGISATLRAISLTSTPSGTDNQPFSVTETTDKSITYWTEVVGGSGVYYQPATANFLGAVANWSGLFETFIKFHYTKDARYGVV